MQDRIWETFMQRVVQEERANASAKTVRYLTMYYAAWALAAAVLSTLYPTDSWRVVSTLMTALLALIAIFQCAGPFDARLRLIQRDQAELEALRAEAGEQDADEASMGQRLQLIIASGANVSAQERRAYERMKDRSEKWQAACDGRPVQPKRLFGYEKFLYWLIEIAGMVFLAAALLLPAAGVVLAACGLL